MESPFDKNIEFLTAHFSHLLKKLLSPDTLAPYTFVQGSPPNIVHGKRAFHSKADPEREALRSVQNIIVQEGTLILFLGLGMGYHVEKFMKLYNTAGARVVVVEKSAEAFTILVQNRDISFLQGVKLFIAETPSSIIDYFESLSPVSFRGHRVIRLRGAFELFSQYYTKIQSTFAALMSARLSDMLTRFAFESLWLKNFISNIPLLSGRRSIAALKGTLAKSPVLVIGAGPSLKNQLPLIARIAPTVHIIAVDTAVGPLVMCGIIPDFIVSLDAQYFNTCDFFSLFSDVHTAETVYRRSVLVTDIVVCPQILKNWKGDIYFSETSYSPDSDYDGFNGNIPLETHSLSLLLHTYFHDIDSLECGGSVTTTALELALYLGTAPVYVTGLDLSYTGYQTHVSSSPFYNELYRTSSRFAPLQTLITGSIRGRKIHQVPGKDGRMVVSDFIFLNYLKWLESRAVYESRVVNVTESGLQITGIVHQTLEKCAAELSSREKKPDMRLHTSQAQNWDRPPNRNRPRDGSLIRDKSPDRYKPLSRGRPLSRETALLFLHTLQKESNEAKSILNEHGFDMQAFMGRFAFLRNSTLHALHLYKSEPSIKNHLLLLLRFLDRYIQKACKKLDAG